MKKKINKIIAKNNNGLLQIAHLKLFVQKEMGILQKKFNRYCWLFTETE